MEDEKKETEEQKEEAQETTEQESKTFTQAELDAVIGRQKGKAQSSLLKELGFDSLDTAKAFLEEGKKLKQEQMTEAEKLKANNKEIEDRATAAEERAMKAEIKAAALELGARADRVSDIMKLLPEGEEPIQERMKAFLNDRPEYLKKNGSSFSNESKNQELDKEKAAREKIRKSLGLK